MIRKHLPLAALRGERYFRWRGGDVSRIEGITDAVMALAMTLLIASLEVPRAYDELVGSFRQLPAFAVCGALLMMIWYYHFQFNRRYGLENLYTIFLNSALLFLVLFYVYPLKFLFTRLFDRLLYDGPGLRGADGRELMILYSSGYVLIFVLFLLMNLHAYKHRDVLELNEVERSVARGSIREHGIHIGIASLSIALAAADPQLTPFAGLIYFLMGPAQAVHGWLSSRRISRLAEHAHG